MEVEETRFVAHSDPIYVQRLSKPTKSFSIDYIYNNPNYKLKIEGFGANANLTDGKFIKSENGNFVSFDMLSWLLPGNGILIATIPLERISKEQEDTDALFSTIVNADGSINEGKAEDAIKEIFADERRPLNDKEGNDNPATSN